MLSVSRHPYRLQVSHRTFTEPCVTPLCSSHSSIPQAYKWAEAYKPQPGRPLLDMSQGVPGIPPPKSLLDALAVAASDPDSCGYVPNAGEPALRKAVASEMKKVYGEGTDVTAEDVFITAGCNLAFTAAVMTVAEKGDEVILPVPWCAKALLLCLHGADGRSGTSTTSECGAYRRNYDA